MSNTNKKTVKLSIFPGRFYVALFIFVVISYFILTIERHDTVINKAEHITRFSITGNLSGTQVNEVNKFIVSSYYKKPLNVIKKEITAELENKFLFINAVVLTENWHTLKVNITEYTPIAHFNYHKLVLTPEPHFINNQYISSSGHVYTDNLPVTNKNLPHIYAPDAYKKYINGLYQETARVLKKFNLHIETFTIKKSGVWIVNLTNGMVLQFGVNNQFAELNNFSKIYPHINIPDNQKIAYINLSYENGAAVRFS